MNFQRDGEECGVAKAWECGERESWTGPGSWKVLCFLNLMEMQGQREWEVVGREKEGVAPCGMMHHTQAILSPQPFPMVDAQFLHHCLKTVAQSPAAGTLDTASVPDVWTGLDDGK